MVCKKCRYLHVYITASFRFPWFLLSLDLSIVGDIKIFNLQAVECNIYVYSYLIFIRMVLNMRVLTGFIFIIFLYYRIAILVFFLSLQCLL